MKKKRKKKKAAGRRKGVWNLDGSKISDLLHHTQWNRTKISGVCLCSRVGKSAPIPAQNV